MSKFIDEKGMLFGKINIIDFLVLVVIFCFIPMIYFGHKIFTMELDNKVAGVSDEEKITIETGCQFIKIKPETINKISVNDVELNEDGNEIGRITKLGKIRPYTYEFGVGKGKKIVKIDPKMKELEVKLKLVAIIKDESLYYKDKLIKIDSPLEFHTEKYTAIAVPFEVEKQTSKKAEEVNVRIKVKFVDLLPEIVELINIGDKQIEITQGSDENETYTEWVAVKINKITSNIPAEVIVMGFGGVRNIYENPKYRNIVLELEVLCQRKPKGFFLKNQPVKAGMGFTFSSARYTISGLIIGVDFND